MHERAFGRFRLAKGRLANGVRVVTASDEEAKSTALRVVTKTGSAFEAAEQQGIAHFVEHMLFQGTERYPSFNAIGRAIESLGGMINGATDRLKTVYWVKVLPEHAGTGLELLADLMNHSRFTLEDIERERSVIAEEIHRRHDRPDEFVGTLLGRAMWPEQPLGRETLGRLETIRALRRDDLRSYLETQYRGGDVVVAAAGATRHDEIMALAEGHLGGLPASGEKILPTGQFGSGQDVVVEQRPTAQVQLAMGFPGIGHEDGRIYAARLIATALGQGVGSRLFLAVRQRLGLAYSISAHVLDVVRTGDLQIRAGIKAAGIDDPLRAILLEIGSLRDEAMSEEELGRAKAMAKSRLAFLTESADAVAERLGGHELLLGRTVSVEEEIAAFDATTAEDVQQVAKWLLDPSGIKIAAIGEVERDEVERALNT